MINKNKVSKPARKVSQSALTPPLFFHELIILWESLLNSIGSGVQTCQIRDARTFFLFTLILVGFSLPVSAQTETTVTGSSNFVNVPDNDPDGFNSQVTFNSIPLGAVLTDIDLSLAINHTHLGDLKITLIGPSGETIVLMDRPKAETFVSANFNSNHPISFSGSYTNDPEEIGSVPTLFDNDTACDDDGVCEFYANDDTPNPKTFEMLKNAVNANGGPRGTWTVNIADLSGGTTGNFFIEALSLTYTTELSTQSLSYNFNPLATILDNNPSGTSRTLDASNFPSDETLTWIELELGINHDRAGDLRIELEAPTGDKITLVSEPGRVFPDVSEFSTADLDDQYPITFTDGARYRAKSMGGGAGDEPPLLGSDEVICEANNICSFHPGDELNNTKFLSDLVAEVNNGTGPAGDWIVTVSDLTSGRVGNYRVEALTLYWIGCPDDDIDGVCNEEDQCPGADDTADADGDLVPDGCDQCPGIDDAILPVDPGTIAFSDGSTALSLCKGESFSIIEVSTGSLSDYSRTTIIGFLENGNALYYSPGVFPRTDVNIPANYEGEIYFYKYIYGDDIGVANSPTDIEGCHYISDEFLTLTVFGDADNDGVCDEDDQCPGFDDTVDTDGDTVPDGCDACEGSDDLNPTDTDGDSVPDECDACQGSDDLNPTDTDGDDVPDACDVCQGSDDTVDTDGDTTPDGCDVCDDTIDEDQNGIADCQEISILYVRQGATAGGDGRSWETAFPYLQDALAYASTYSTVNEIWVAKGTYYPDEGNSVTQDDRTETFQLITGLSILGGFNGTEGSSDVRDIENNTTVLSGDIDHETNPDNADANGVVTDGNQIQGNNAYHVVTGSDTDATALLDGFTVTAGQANGSDKNGRGGGIMNSKGSPTFRSIVLSGNTADLVGGGMFNIRKFNDINSPTLTNIVFSGNTAGIHGGGMSNTISNPTLTDVSFIGNSAAEDGGGIQNYESDPTLTNVSLIGNTAGVDGGGMVNSYSIPTLINLSFIENRAGRNGGGIYNSPGDPIIINLSFSGNIANKDGGAIYNERSSTTNIYNSVFHGNLANGSVESIFGENNSFTNISNSYFDDAPIDAVDANDAPVNYNIVNGENPFVDAANGNLQLIDNSTAIDAGDNDELPNGITLDLAGNPRKYDDAGVADADSGTGAIIDMGAYEKQTDSCPDADSDGVCDEEDRCPGFDDSLDIDGDGVADGCDVCEGSDDLNPTDTDGDSVPDECDVCQGSDDNIDADGDGIPDGCDAANVFIDANNNLVFTDPDGEDDELTITIVGDNYKISDANRALLAGEGATQSGNDVLAPITMVTGNIQINTQDGDDGLTVDLSGGNIVDDLVYDGGDQSVTPGDVLSLTGGNIFDVVTHTFVSENDGSIAITGNGIITYTGLEPITDNLSAIDRVFTFTAGDETITLSNSGALANQIDSDLGEVVDFTNPSNSLTINASTGQDIINIQGLDVSFDANLTINTDSDLDLDLVNFQTNDTNLGSGNLLVNSDELTINTDIITTGSITTQTLKTTTISGGDIQTTDEDISITAGTAQFSGVDSYGVEVENANIKTTGIGSIVINGTGGPGTGSRNIGIDLRDLASIQTQGSGSITLTGNGGTGSVLCVGIQTFSGSTITSNTGSITLNGTSGAGTEGSSVADFGIRLNDVIQSTGGGNINLTGVSNGLGTENEDGVRIGNTTIITNGGDINILGTGSTSSTLDFNQGVVIQGTNITTTNTGTINITGTGGSGRNSNRGVIISSGSLITSADGNINISGTSTDADAITDFAVGIELVQANITITGTGNVIMNGTSAKDLTPAVFLRQESFIEVLENVTINANVGKLANTPLFQTGDYVEATNFEINGEVQIGRNNNVDVITTFPISANLLLSNNDILAFDISGFSNPGTDYDQVVVKGTVNINDATLVLNNQLDNAEYSDETIVLIDNDGADAIIGTFNGVAEGDVVLTGTTQNFVISYIGGDGNDVTLNSVCINDADSDGICDEDDQCPGFDDGVDTDGDGVPDGCDFPILYVRQGAATGGNGKSWATAFKYLQDALTFANSNNSVEEIWVAKGVYFPDDDEAGNVTDNDPTETFQLINGVKILGGFNGTESSSGTRAPEQYETILSGDIEQDDLDFAPTTDSDANSSTDESTDHIVGVNTYHVVTASDTDATAVLDGFSITSGRALNVANAREGAGIINYYGSPILLNLAIYGNEAYQRGAGMLNWGGSAELINVTFSDNLSTGGGGAMFNDFVARPVLEKVSFLRNKTLGVGGAMFNSQSTPTLNNVVFSGNIANGGGGAISGFLSSLSITNTTFLNNSSGNDGAGAIYNYLVNNTISNTIFYDNKAGSNIKSIVNLADDGSVIPIDINSITNSYFDDEPGDFPDASGNLVNQPDPFIDAANGNLQLVDNSAAIDAGDNAAIPSGVTTDIAGNPRKYDDAGVEDTGSGTSAIVDMGAYEKQTDSCPDSDNDRVCDAEDQCPGLDDNALIDPGALIFGDGSTEFTICKSNSETFSILEQAAPNVPEYTNLIFVTQLQDGSWYGEGLDASFLGSELSTDLFDPRVYSFYYVTTTEDLSIDEQGNPVGDCFFISEPIILTILPDADDDGVCDDVDLCPGSDDTVDVDNDGVADCVDQELDSPCPDDVDANGVSNDEDGDGTPNCADDCDDTIDTDNDGVADCVDQELNSPCPDDVDANGVSNDDDGDGTPNCADDCDDTIDADNDGVADCVDQELDSPCPDDVDANGVSHDDDGDGIANCEDSCDDAIDPGAITWADGSTTLITCPAQVTIIESAAPDLPANTALLYRQEDTGTYLLESSYYLGEDLNTSDLLGASTSATFWYITMGDDFSMNDTELFGCYQLSEPITLTLITDSDDDGLCDNEDAEPNSPCPDDVDANGISNDDDDDGTPNCQDACLGIDDALLPLDPGAITFNDGSITLSICQGEVLTFSIVESQAPTLPEATTVVFLNPDAGIFGNLIIGEELQSNTTLAGTYTIWYVTAGDNFNINGNGEFEGCYYLSNPITLTVAEQCNQAPVAICQDITVYTGEDCQATITATQLDGGSSDPEGSELTFSLNEQGPFAVGEQLLTLTVSDGELSSTCTATLTIEDNTAPSVLCQDVTIQLDENGLAAVSATAINNGSSDACGLANLSLNKANFDCSNTGENTVTVTATDLNGNSNSCQATVTVEDDTKPTLTCPEDITVNTDQGECGAFVTLPKAAPIDNCGIKNLKSRYRHLDQQANPLGGWSAWAEDHSGFFEPGFYQIQWRAKDDANNQGLCSYQLSVIDQEAPEVICTDLTIDFNGEASISIASTSIFDAAASFDACGTVSFMSQSVTAVSCDQVGETLSVEVIGVDPHGNTAACTAQLTVVGMPCGFEATDIDCENGASASYDPVEESFTLSANDCSGYPQGEYSIVKTELCGDGEIVAQISSLSGDGRAGLIMMENADSEARFVGIIKDLTRRVRTEYRISTGGNVSSKRRTRSGVDWLRIVRTGSRFRTYTSTNGNNWRLVHTISFSNFADCIQVGMLVYTKNANEPITAVFENVKVIGDSPSALEQPITDAVHQLQITDDQQIQTDLGTGVDLNVAPNPFADQTQIEFTLPNASDVTLEIYNLHGQRVQSLESAQLDAGNHRYQWNGQSSKGEPLPTGIYMLRLRADKKWITTKVSLVNR